MQSLRSRFNGNSQKVVEYARNYGTLNAMEQFQVKDYLAMENFLKEMAPDEEFRPVKHDPDSFSQPDAFDKLLEAMLRKYANLEAEIAKRDSEIEKLKRDLNYFKATRWNEAGKAVQAILKECSEEVR